jgi:hypothetical protein
MKIRALLIVAVALACSDAKAGCLGCTEEERNSVQLNEMLETVKILKLIKIEADELDADTLQFYLSRVGTSEEITELLKLSTPPESVEQKNPTKKKKPTSTLAAKKLVKAPKFLTNKNTGLDGLLVAHAQSANPAINYAASATVVSYGRAIPLAIGNTFEHNTVMYELVSVDAYQNPDSTVAHAVIVKNTKDGAQTVLPWNAVKN